MSLVSWTSTSPVAVPRSTSHSTASLPPASVAQFWTTWPRSRTGTPKATRRWRPPRGTLARCVPWAARARPTRFPSWSPVTGLSARTAPWAATSAAWRSGERSSSWKERDRRDDQPARLRTSVDECLGLRSQNGLDECGGACDGGTLNEIAEGQLPTGCALGADYDPAGRSYGLDQHSHLARVLEPLRSSGRIVVCTQC